MFDVYTAHKGRYGYAGRYASGDEIARHLTGGGRQAERVRLAAEAAEMYGEPYTAKGIGARDVIVDFRPVKAAV